MTLRRYALLGQPVTGSKSPLIHTTSFSFNDICASYEAFEVSPHQLGEALEAFIREGYSGFNITIPHKEAVLAFVDELDPLAAQMGAVNTLSLEDGKIKGYNTDGPGLLAALDKNGIEIKDLSVLVLGAGGAAKGICHALAMGGACRIDLFNRSKDKAASLAALLRQTYGVESEAVLLESPVTEYALVINTTSVGMVPDTDAVPVAPELFRAETVFCDIVYKPHETLFLKRAKAMGAQCVYGIEMLLFQALLSEQIWEKRPLDLEGTRAALYETKDFIYQSPK